MNHQHVLMENVLKGFKSKIVLHHLLIYLSSCAFVCILIFHIRVFLHPVTREPIFDESLFKAVWKGSIRIITVAQGVS